MSLGVLSTNFLRHALFLYPPFGDFRSPSCHSGALWCLAPFLSTTNFCFL